MALPALLLLFIPAFAGPSSAADWKAIGIQNTAAGKMDAALAAFERACELDPKDEDSCYFYARTLFALDRWDEARPIFEKAVQTASRPKLARVHRAIALNYLALGDTQKAESHFHLAIRFYSSGVSPEDPRVDYGAFLFRQGRLEEALVPLQDAIKDDSASSRAHTELGRVLLHLGKADLAAVSLEKAVNLDPRSSAARLLLGRAYLRLGRVEDGQKQLHLARTDGSRTDGSMTVR